MSSNSPQSLSLASWLAELERRHPRAIELGLDRVGAVWRALGGPRPARKLLTVGGTNGKGSTVAFIEAAARALGWRVGAYTSPHLLRYNERIRIDGAEVDDAAIVAAFERIEAARGEIALTYFEFGTLAALLSMAAADLDLALLEVGLGGRLDAVNILDADVAVVTTVALDHQDWLGDTRASIAREKAGIARAGRPLLIGERDAEPALIEAARAAAARVYRLGIDFDCGVEVEAGEAVDWQGVRPDAEVRTVARRWWFRGRDAVTLPSALPLSGAAQWDNAVTALAALYLLAEQDAEAMQTSMTAAAPATRPAFALESAAAGLAQAQLRGRLQKLSTAPEVRLDVGHNPHAAQALAGWLAGDGAGVVTDAVFSALSDKDLAGTVRPLLPHIRYWHLAGLDAVTSRGLDAGSLAEKLTGVVPAASIRLHADVATALSAARVEAGASGRVLVFGSFFTVAQVLQAG